MTAAAARAFVRGRASSKAAPGSKTAGPGVSVPVAGTDLVQILSGPPRAGREARKTPAAALAQPGGAGPDRDGEVLGLQPGEWVQVKSEPEILATLDSAGRHRGLAYLDEMRRYSGRRYKVFKRVERIFLEESKQIRSLRNTVLLEGVHCGGAGFGCDKACLLYWREAWLTRCSPPRLEPGSAPGTITHD